jgi:hypothetical protein
MPPKITSAISTRLLERKLHPANWILQHDKQRDHNIKLESHRLNVGQALPNSANPSRTTVYNEQRWRWRWAQSPSPTDQFHLQAAATTFNCSDLAL